MIFFSFEPAFSSESSITKFKARAKFLQPSRAHNSDFFRRFSQGYVSQCLISIKVFFLPYRDLHFFVLLWFQNDLNPDFLLGEIRCLMVRMELTCKTPGLGSDSCSWISRTQFCFFLNRKDICTRWKGKMENWEGIWSSSDSGVLVRISIKKWRLMAVSGSLGIAEGHHWEYSAGWSQALLEKGLLTSYRWHALTLNFRLHFSFYISSPHF